MSSFEKIAESSYLRMSWKNGGGVTDEIARHSVVGSDSYNWRLSRALVSSDGAFSQFIGYSRLLTILDGDGLSLDLNQKELLKHDVLAFEGVTPIFARLIGGLVVDLGLIYDGARFAATMQIASGRLTLTEGSTSFLYCCSGSFTFNDFEISKDETLKCVCDQTLTIDLGAAQVVSVELRPIV